MNQGLLKVIYSFVTNKEYREEAIATPVYLGHEVYKAAKDAHREYKAEEEERLIKAQSEPAKTEYSKGQRFYLFSGKVFATAVCLGLGALCVGHWVCPFITPAMQLESSGWVDVYALFWKLFLIGAFGGLWWYWCQQLRRHVTEKNGEYQKMRKFLGNEDDEK